MEFDRFGERENHMIQKLLALKNSIINYLLPDRMYKSKKKRWDANWSGKDFSPPWTITKIPDEFREAVDSGWFTPGSSVLDIGCGRGEIAAWLAEQNFKVVGIDYSKSAIDKARSDHGEVQGKLIFKTVDICRKNLDATRFDILIDRGCFHGIGKTFSSDYERGVGSWSGSGRTFFAPLRYK